MQLISLETLKAYLEIPTDSTANYVATNFDSLLNSIIDYVSDRIQLYLNRELEVKERTDYFESGRRKYYVQAYPLVNPTTMTVKIGTSEMDYNSDYYVRDKMGLIEFYFKTTYVRPQEIEITYIGGYTTTSGVVDVPDSLKYACLLQCAFVFRKRKDIGNDWTGTPDVNRISTPYSGMDLLKEVKDVLYLHRRQPGDM